MVKVNESGEGGDREEEGNMKTEEGEQGSVGYKVHEEEILKDQHMLERGGIVTLVNGEGMGFSCRVKAFPEDFRVNEILSDGTLVTLEDAGAKGNAGEEEFVIPAATADGTLGGRMVFEEPVAKPGAFVNVAGRWAAVKAATAAAAADRKADDTALSNTIHEVEELFPKESVEALVAFAEQQAANPPVPKRKDRPAVVVEMTHQQMDSKQVRAASHLAVKNRWPFLKTRTFKCIKSGGGDKFSAEYDPAYDVIRGLLSPEDLHALQVFVLKTSNQSRKGADQTSGFGGPSLRVAFGADKERRTAIHQCLSRYIHFLQATTDDGRGDNGVVSITIFRRPPRHTGVSKAGNKRTWDDANRESERNWYTAFCVEKVKVENLQCITAIANALGCSPSSLSQHGTKDKIGVTCQRMAVRWKTPNDLRCVSVPGVTIGKIEHIALLQPLRLGDLKGNRFQIRLRDIRAPREPVMARVASLEANGFINYFGTQRVGIWSKDGIVSHRVGAAMAQGDYKKAVSLLLRSQGEHRARLNEVIDAYEASGDAKKALKDLPTGCRVQEMVIKSLQRNGSDAYVEAIKAVPYNARSMYLETFQSFVWNCVASKRLVKLGRKPAVGDLVLVEPGAEPSPGASKVRRLTEDDLKDGSKITLYDVVLPLPGRSIEYPSHEGGEWYRQALEKEGVDMSDPCKRMPEFSGQFSGAYRSLMMRVSSLDAKELKSDTGEVGKERWDLQLSFDLCKGCYATCALWELMMEVPRIEGAPCDSDNSLEHIDIE